MYKLNDKIKNMQPYMPLEGDYKIRLDANESFIPLDGNIKKQIAELAINIPYHRYPDPLAKSACSAFADFYDISEKNVTAGNGSDELISIIINSFFQKGDKLAVTSPDFSMYNFYSHLSEVEVVNISKDGLTSLNAEEIINAVKDSAVKGVIFSNPCNPTSCGMLKNDVLKIVETLNDKLVIVDEAYMDFMDESILGMADNYNNLIVLKTCSKFGIAAIRLGFAVSGKTITNALRAVKSPYNVNTLTCEIAALVFRNKDYLKDCINKITAQRIKLYEALTKICKDSVIDSCTNFVVIKTDKATEIYKALLKKSIAIRNFGSYLRITAGNDYENNAFVEAFKELI